MVAKPVGIKRKIAKDFTTLADTLHSAIVEHQLHTAGVACAEVKPVAAVDHIDLALAHQFGHHLFTVIADDFNPADRGGPNSDLEFRNALARIGNAGAQQALLASR